MKLLLTLLIAVSLQAHTCWNTDKQKKITFDWILSSYSNGVDEELNKLSVYPLAVNTWGCTYIREYYHMETLTTEEIQELKDNLVFGTSLKVENRQYETLLYSEPKDNPQEILGKVSPSDIDTVFEIIGGN